MKSHSILESTNVFLPSCLFTLSIKFFLLYWPREVLISNKEVGNSLEGIVALEEHWPYFFLSLARK